MATKLRALGNGLKQVVKQGGEGYGRQYLHGTMPLAVAAAALATADTAECKSDKAKPRHVPWGELIIYQYATCPFCNKVRAFLDYHGVPYRAVEVNPLMKKEIKWSGHRKVPIVVVDGEKLVESSEIIDELRNRLAKSNAGWLTSSSEYRKESQKESQWRRWVDDRWVHVITPNIYRTVGEAKQAFDYMTTAGNFGFVEREVARWFGAAFMYGLSKYRLKPRHGIHEERPALYEAAQQWCEGLGGKPFMGGRRPGLADLSMFGATRAIKGMDAFNDLMANTPIRPWYERMEARVGPTSQLPQE